MDDALGSRHGAANKLAKHYLELGHKITHQMAWEVLSRWSCQRHKRRLYIRQDDEEYMRSQMLGINQNFHTGRPPASLVFGQSSTNNEHFVRFLNQYLSEMLEDIQPTDERHKLRASFHWASICINQQVLCKRHHDKHNEGDVSHHRPRPLQRWQAPLLAGGLGGSTQSR